MMTIIVVNAQNKTNDSVTTIKRGPTKEQTLEYLKATLNVWGGYSGNLQGDVWEFKQTLKELTMNGCVLKFNIIKKTDANKEDFSNENENKEIDISLVESVKIKKIGETPLSDNLGIYFTIQNKPIIVEVYCTPENSEKVLKAFNHLRKLCGAPEPISFD